MTVEINGMAHVILTVSRFEVAREFYRRLLPEFGMKVVHDGDKLFYCVGARTAIGIQPSTRLWRASASCSSASASTTSAFAPGHARTWTAPPRC